jgi:hypothetical protein
MDSLLLGLTQDKEVSRVEIDICGTKKELIRHLYKKGSNGTSEIEIGGLKGHTTDIPHNVYLSHLSVAMDGVSATEESVIMGAVVYRNTRIDNADFYKEAAQEIKFAEESKRLQELERKSKAD